MYQLTELCFWHRALVPSRRLTQLRPGCCKNDTVVDGSVTRVNREEILHARRPFDLVGELRS
eukprot:349379-Pleurochrysis_carterae.AAC.1